jgi:hypothetical protein
MRNKTANMKEYQRHYAETHREHIRNLHREWQRKHRQSKIKQSYVVPVAKLGIIHTENMGFSVEELKIIAQYNWIIRVGRENE